MYTGVCLSDEVIMQAAARRVSDLKQLVTGLCEATPPGLPQQQLSALSEAVRKMLTSTVTEEDLEKVWAPQ
jgi:hypothetical protein